MTCWRDCAAFVIFYEPLANIGGFVGIWKRSLPTLAIFLNLLGKVLFFKMGK